MATTNHPMREPTERLDEINKLEARDLMRHFRPEVTDAEFEKIWQEFVEKKRQKQLN